MSVEINVQDFAVTAVTVYKGDRALVQRRLPVTLQSGQNEISITRLPPFILNDSIRVEAEGASSSQHLTVFDVTHVPPSYNTSPTPEAAARLATIDEQRKSLASRIVILEKQQAVLRKYSDDINPVGSGGLFGPEALEKFLDVYGTRQTAIDEQLVALRKEREDAEKAFVAMNNKANVTNADKKLPGVKIIMLAKEDGAATIVLSYVVSQATWTSLYDVRAELSATTATSGKSPTSPTVQLQYRASIHQQTGEDWDGVALTLSTSSPTLGSDIPTLNIWRINPVRPKPVQRAVTAARSSRKFGGPRMSRMLDTSAEVEEEREESDDDMGFGLFDDGPSITVNEGGISLSYTIAGKSTITSDSSWHRVSIVNLDLPAELEWVTVPRKLTSAFLRCRIRNTSAFELISGPGSVFIDGNFASKTTIPNVSPQESFPCSLGVDPSLRITYHPQKKIATSSNTSGFMAVLSNNKNGNVVTSYKQRITIKNTRSSPVARLVVQDQVPVSEDSKLRVSVQQPSEKSIGPVGGSSNPPPTPSTSTAGSSGLVKTPSAPPSEQTLTAQVSKNIIARWGQKSDEKGGSGGSRQDGVIEWVCSNVPPAETLDLELVYDISAPVDLEWEGM